MRNSQNKNLTCRAMISLRNQEKLEGLRSRFKEDEIKALELLQRELLDVLRNVDCKELFEAYEIFTILKENGIELKEERDTIFDFGCMHGYTSLLLRNYFVENVPIVWIDKDVDCIAAKNAEKEEIVNVSFAKTLEVGNRSGLVLCVNVCGVVLLNLLDSLKDCEDIVVCCVPCCGLNSDYEEWIKDVKTHLSEGCTERKMKTNFGRTVLISKNKKKNKKI